MTLDELREHPAIKEHWPHVQRVVDQYLDSVGIETALGASCEASRAQAESAANRCIAQLRKSFRLLAEPKEKVRPSITTKPLHRFAGDEAQPKPADNQ